jgi:hypothetical protein
LRNLSVDLESANRELSLYREMSRKKSRKRATSSTAKRKRSKRYKSTEAGTITFTDREIALVIPKKLRSGNVLKSGIARHGDTKSWENHILKLVTSDVSVDSLKPMGSPQKMRLEIVREAPFAHHFLDPTNLHIGSKGLEDALVRLGYLHDDSQDWVDGPHCSNAVSPTKTYRTLVRIRPAA